MYDYNQLGRPPKPNALTRTGKLINFILSKSGQEKLRVICKVMRLSQSDTLRELIDEKYKSLNPKI